MAYNKGLVATLAELEDFYKGQEAGDLIELLNQTNDILTDVQWMEANQSDGHLTRIRTGLPAIYWRQLYKGTPPSKSTWAQVKEGCSRLEARMELDQAEVEMYGDRAKAFRLSEGKAFTEAMRQKVASTMFYGNTNTDPREFNGLAMRYPSSDSPNVLDARGTTESAMTSMYLVSWGATTVHGIYPKGSTAGLSKEDLGVGDAFDADGNAFRAVRDIYKWNVGLAVRDWRAVVRICNIDTTYLAARKGDDTFIDLQALTIQAKNRMPEALRNNAIWYCNQDVLTALEMQASDAGNVQLQYGEYFASKTVPVLHGRPVRQCDAILSTETVLTAAE